VQTLLATTLPTPFPNTSVLCGSIAASMAPCMVRTQLQSHRRQQPDVLLQEATVRAMWAPLLQRRHTRCVLQTVSCHSSLVLVLVLAPTGLFFPQTLTLLPALLLAVWTFSEARQPQRQNRCSPPSPGLSHLWSGHWRHLLLH